MLWTNTIEHEQFHDDDEHIVLLPFRFSWIFDTETSSSVSLHRNKHCIAFDVTNVKCRSFRWYYKSMPTEQICAYEMNRKSKIHIHVIIVALIWIDYSTKCTHPHFDWNSVVLEILWLFDVWRCCSIFFFTSILILRPFSHQKFIEQNRCSIDRMKKIQNIDYSTLHFIHK